MDLIDRKYRILQAIIDDYILTALPVGSRTISRKYEQKLSSATIRNEMSDLEELGYLDSPHTSAGRVPSNKAYRLYVDRMLRPAPLSVEETAFIRSCFDMRARQVEEMTARMAKALSSVTHYTAAVMTRTPRAEQRLSHLQLVPVSERRCLLILVTTSGAVRQHILDLDAPVAPDELYTVSRILSQQLAGCPLSQLSAELATQAGGAPDAVRGVVSAMAQDAPPPDYYAMMRELHGIGNNLNQIAVKAHTLNVLDVQRYDENCRKLDEAIKTITAAVILPHQMK